jgi:hypothetical protein
VVLVHEREVYVGPAVGSSCRPPRDASPRTAGLRPLALERARVSSAGETATCSTPSAADGLGSSMPRSVGQVALELAVTGCRR